LSISLTQSNSAENASGTSQAVTLSAALAAGDLIVVAGRWGNQSGTITASDGPGTTYVHVTTSPLSDGASSGNEAFLMWGILGAGQSSLTVTVSVASGGSHRLTVGVFDYNSTSGWSASQPETSNSNSNSTPGTSGTTGSITTANTDLIFAVLEAAAAVAAGSATVNSPFSIQNAGGSAGNGFASSSRAFGGDDQNAASGSFNCTFNWTNTAAFAALVAAFKPAAAVVPVFEDDSLNMVSSTNLTQYIEPVISVW
jgi:hypothetical protein